MRTLRRVPLGVVWLLFMLAVASILAVLAPTRPPCRAEATAGLTVPTDWCYRFTVSVTNATASPLTNYGVRVPINAGNLIAQSRMSRYAWDLRPVNSTMAAIEVTTQELADNPAYWWILYPSIPASTTVQTLMFIGNATGKRDQGFFFTGGDTITVADAAGLQITDDLDLRVTVQSPLPDSDAWIFEKLDAGETLGYGLGSTITGAGKILGQVDNQLLEVAWDGTEKTVRMTFVQPTLTIYFLNADGETWDSQGSLATGMTAISTPADALVMGGGFVGTIRQATLMEAGVKVAEWSFNPREGTTTDVVSETTAADPVFTGQVRDDMGSYTGTYSLSRAQAGVVTVAVGGVATTFADSIVSLTQQFQDVYGPMTESDVFTPVVAAQFMPGYQSLSVMQAASGLTAEAFWFGVSGGLGVIAAIGPVIWIRSVVLGLAIVATFFVLANLLGLLAPYVTIVVILTAIGVWLLSRWGR